MMKGGVGFVCDEKVKSEKDRTEPGGLGERHQ